MLKPIAPALLALVLVFAVGGTLTGCASLPPQDGRTPSAALAPGEDTTIGRALAPLTAAHA
ncbi:hypothetical protein LP420_36240 [Massilia sp. B-10]|nr:hypothetical protein LP420_36240 [Massilia sp. B-10]